MATYRIFCYNPTGATISGTEQVGSIAAATGDVSIDPTKQWWNGPDEDVRYIVAYSSINSSRNSGPKRVLGGTFSCNLGFIGSSAKTDESFLNLAKTISGSSSLASASAAKTWLNTNGYWTSWTAAAVSYLLDTYGGATVAYSLRKLSNAYSGSAIRVRRSSDNTEQNIGFDGSGNLDESALTSFVGAGDGFVTTWYDQSGNSNNATQTSAIEQPQIVSSGSYITVSGTSKPMIKFGTTTPLNLTTLINVDGTDSSQFMTYQKSSTGNNVTAWQNGAYFTWLNYGNTQYYGNSAITDADFNIANELMVVSITMDYGNKLEFFKNNISQQTKTSAFSAEQRFNILFPSSVSRIESFCNEFIFYSSDQNSNVSGINTNINNYYSIYPTDSDAAAFVSAAGITDATQMSAINTLVTDLKGYGIWTKMKALYPFVGGSATSHKFNLKDPRDLDAAYRLVFNGGWTHSSTGALPNGTNAYADAYITNSAMSYTSTHLSVYSRTNNLDGISIGNTTNQYCLIYPRQTGDIFYSGINAPGFMTATVTDSTGHFLATRRGNTDSEAYRNGVSIATSTSAMANDNTTMYLGAAYRQGVGAIGYDDRELAFASIGDGLTDTEAANFYTAVQAFQTTLGRQV